MCDVRNNRPVLVSENAKRGSGAGPEQPLLEATRVTSSSGVIPPTSSEIQKSIGTIPQPMLAGDGIKDNGHRIKLWQTSDNIHCSVVGTCATVKAIKRLAAKVGLELRPGLADYDVHGLLVRETCSDNPFNRAFHKAMDRRYTGIVRQVARTKGEKQLTRLWTDLRNQGQIAGAYWAFMTFRHVPRDLRYAIFGEVHMLSHIAGASFREQAAQSTRLQDQLEEAEDRAKRVEAGLHDSISERDIKIQRLKQENLDLRKKIASLAGEQSQAPDGSARKAMRRLEKMERALIAARTRARQAETQLAEQSNKFVPRLDKMTALRSDSSGQQTSGLSVTLPLAGKSVLYVGGRASNVTRLRSIAAEFEADLIYHDGGLESSVHRLDQVLQSVDCVFCPIDCVSHDACVRARRACSKLGKPFMPLKTASQTALRTAMTEMAQPESAIQSSDPAHEH